LATVISVHNIITYLPNIIITYYYYFRERSSQYHATVLQVYWYIPYATYCIKIYGGGGGTSLARRAAHEGQVTRIGAGYPLWPSCAHRAAAETDSVRHNSPGCSSGSLSRAQTKTHTRRICSHGHTKRRSVVGFFLKLSFSLFVSELCYRRKSEKKNYNTSQRQRLVGRKFASAPVCSRLPLDRRRW